MSKNVDWRKIRREYINTKISVRKIAAKYNLSYGTVRARAEKEEWLTQRAAQEQKIMELTTQKTVEKISEKLSDQAVDIKSVADSVIEQVLKAAEQLPYKTDKITKKVRQYDPQRNETKEQIVLTEDLTTKSGAIDTKKAKEIMDCLKAYADICMMMQGKNNAEDNSGVEIVFDF